MIVIYQKISKEKNQMEMENSTNQEIQSENLTNQENPIKKTRKRKNSSFGNLRPDNEVISDLEELKNKIDESKSQEKKKTYRTSKAEQVKAEKDAAEFAEMMTGVGSFLMDTIIKRMPKPTPLDQNEKQVIDTAFQKVFIKYAGILGNYQAETALVSVVLITLLPRTDLLSKKVTPKDSTTGKIE